MAVKFLERKQILGFKLESTPYTAETLVSADYNLRAENIKYSPNIEMLVRNHSTNTFAKEQSIMGKQSGKLSFRVYLSASGSASTPPSWFLPARACGMAQTIFGATGVSLTTNSTAGRTPSTIAMQITQEGSSPKALEIKLSGCMGEMKLVLDSVGNPVAADFEFQGLINSIVMLASGNVKVFTPSSTESVPYAVLSSVLTAHGQAIDFDKVNIELGNDVQLALAPGNASGFEGAHIVDRSPKITIDPYLADLASYDWYAQQLSNGMNTVTWQIGTGIPITVTAGKAQIDKTLELSDRNKLMVNSIEMSIKGASTASWESELEILQGSKT